MVWRHFNPQKKRRKTCFNSCSPVFLFLCRKTHQNVEKRAGEGEIGGRFAPPPSPRRNVYLPRSWVTFFQAGCVHRAPVCQPRSGAEPKASGPAMGLSQTLPLFLTWLTPRRWARGVACLITAAEQTNTCRLAGVSLGRFPQKVVEFEIIQL